MRKRIVVTQADIDAALAARLAEGSNGGNCPVRRAAERAFPDAGYLWVDRAHIVDVGGGYSKRIAELPLRAIRFTYEFDGDMPVQPFQFTVEVQP